MSSTRPNLGEVARQARVSPATVSRVINNTTPVSDEIRARVLAAAATLGYTGSPSRNAPPVQSLIAFLISDILNPFFPEVVRTIEDEAGAGGRGLLLFNTGENVQSEQRALHMLADRPVEGIIVCASRLANADLIALYERRPTPMVVINQRIDHPAIPSIVVDFESATYRATRHLLNLKHTAIAYLAGSGTSDASLARRRGIELALGEAGLRLRPDWCPTTYPNVEGGFQAMSALLAGGGAAAHPTAVLAYNDVMALGALHAIRAHHLRVPDDISVVGFDDIAMAVHANPPLTTIAQPKQRMGQLAMQMLQQMIRGDRVSGDGYVLVDKPAHCPRIYHSGRAGIGFCSEDRKTEGIIPYMSVRENLTLALLPALARNGIIAADKQQAIVDQFIKRLGIKTAGPDQKIRELSGGNQQKVLLARWMCLNPRLLILDEPTRGIDVGAKAEIQNLINELAEGGLGVLMISSELEELTEGSDRVVVLRDGQTVAELPHAGITEDAIMAAMAHGTAGPPAAEAGTHGEG